MISSPLFRCRPIVVMAALFALPLLAGCDDPPPAAPTTEGRPVRAQVAHRAPLDGTTQLVGEIRPHFESDLGFKIGGRIAWRTDRLGTAVKRGAVVARLDDQDQRNQIATAAADLAAARATLTQAAAEEHRQDQLRRDGWVSQARYESALQARQSAEAAVNAAAARLNLARDQRGYTELRAPEDAVITALGAEGGQVVAPGQMVARLARLDLKDAVFAVAESMLLSAAPHPEIEVRRRDDPSVVTRGTVTEVSPSADPVTRTYTVKVALPNAPESMRFGMTVVGTLRAAQTVPEGFALPASALFQRDGAPALWVVDPATQTVALVPVTVLRLDPDRVLIGTGIEDGTMVVTAGVQSLVPGQRVRLLDSAREDRR